MGPSWNSLSRFSVNLIKWIYKIKESGNLKKLCDFYLYFSYPRDYKATLSGQMGVAGMGGVGGGGGGKGSKPQPSEFGCFHGNYKYHCCFGTVYARHSLSKCFSLKLCLFSLLFFNAISFQRSPVVILTPVKYVKIKFYRSL